jgi:hypothetical protein
MSPLPVTRDAPTLAAVLAALGWRRAPRVAVSHDAHGLELRELVDDRGVSLGCLTWWQTWAALHQLGLLAPDEEMRAALERHVEQAGAWS